MTENDQSAGAPGCGRLLRRTRESMGLSVEDIAAELHLSLRQIEALETDDWEQLPGVTYARGYVRGYARLLGLDAEQLLSGASTQEIELSRVEPEITTQKQKKEKEKQEKEKKETKQKTGKKEKSKETRKEEPTGPRAGSDATVAVSRPPWGLIVGTAVFVAALLLLWQFQGKLAGPWTADEGTASTLQHEPAPEEEAEIAAEAEIAGEPGTESEASEEASAPVSDQPTTPTEPGRVVFQFDQGSWIDVRDAAGNRLLYRNFQAGRRIEVEGEPPFRVFLGNARGVQVEYLGGIVKPDTSSGRLYARFRLAPSG